MMLRSFGSAACLPYLKKYKIMLGQKLFATYNFHMKDLCNILHKLGISKFTLGVAKQLQYSYWKILTLNRALFYFSTICHLSCLLLFFSKIVIAIEKHVKQKKTIKEYNDCTLLLGV